MPLWIYLLYGLAEVFPTVHVSPVSKPYHWQSHVDLPKRYENINAHKDPFLGIHMEPGYINVGKTGGSMYYVSVPQDQKTGAFASDTKKPWGIWLQGGPGCASDFALVHENGPIKVDQNAKPSLNKYSWHKLMDMLWIDQPLGTGFSNAGDICNYATSESDVAINMQEFLQKFVYTHPEFKDRPLYIMGESYAGHYIPAIAWHLAKYPVEGVKLKGVAIGNGWVDPVSQYPAYAKFAFTHGMIDAASYQVATASMKECVNLVKKKSMMGMLVCGMTVSAILGKLNPYDIRLNCEMPPLCYNETNIINFLDNNEVQNKLGVHKKYEECNEKVHYMLTGDWDTQTKTKIVHLLEGNYDVLIYNGVEDFICNWMGTEAWLNSMSWKFTNQFANQKYSNWDIDGHQVGETKKLKNLKFYKIYNAGHMVPLDQPESAFAMLEDFLSESLGEIANTKWANSYEM